MGLFDGTGPDGEAGSTAALARLTGWPVVLVVDARRQGASAAALVAGFARHDPAMPLAGVIFNRVAGARHLVLLEAALARHLPALPCLGAVMQDPGLACPSVISVWFRPASGNPGPRRQSRAPPTPLPPVSTSSG